MRSVSWPNIHCVFIFAAVFASNAEKFRDFGNPDTHTACAEWVTP